MNCPRFYVLRLNEEINKNKNIHHYDKRNEKRWFDLQNIVLKATSAVVEIGNLCLEANNKNEVIHSKDFTVRAIDAITLLGKANRQMAFERKKILKNALLKDYKTTCEQDHSDSKQFLGDDLADSVKKARATHSMTQSISNKRLRLPSSSPRNPICLYSSNSKTSTSTNHSLIPRPQEELPAPQPTTWWSQNQ